MKRWPNKPLGEVCSINPKLVGSDAPSPDAEVTFVPMAAVDEVSGTIARPERRQYSEVAKGYTPFRTNDVLFAKITPCMQNGKAAVAGDLCGGFGFGSTEFHVLRSAGGVLPRWVFAFIRQPAFRSAAEASFTGSAGQQRVPAEFLKAFPIPVPPLAEQERIVKLLDEADELRKLRTQTDHLTADLIPALFHEMFGGYIKSPPVLVSLEKTNAPKGWVRSRLTDVARLATGHTPSRRVPEYWNGNIPWISLTDIRALDGTVAQKTSQSVTEMGIENSSSVKLPKGTVCFSRTASVGFVTVMGREMCTSQDFVNWVCGDRLDPIYLMGALMQAREHLRSLASGSTHKTIYFPTVEQFSVPVPPLALQNEFAARVSEIRAVQAEQSASRRRLDDLFHSLLDRAFRGEL